MKLDPAWSAERTPPTRDHALLGRAVIPDLPFERPDGTPLSINTDYFGQRRNPSNPAPGPFENRSAVKFKVR